MVYLPGSQPSSTSPPTLNSQSPTSKSLPVSLPGSLPFSTSPPTFSSETNQKKFYSAVAQTKETLSKHQLEISMVDGHPIAQIPDDIFEDSAPLWEDFLIGKFVATSAPHVEKIHVIVNKIWTHGDKNLKIDVLEVNQNMVKFRTKEKATRERILRHGMWNIADVSMVIYKLSLIGEESQPDIQTIPMWITLKNVPHRMFSWKGIGCIAGVVGEPKRLHPDTILCKSFEEAKVFVEVDLSKNLPKTFRFQSDKGVDAIVEFSYPWLPAKCVSCSKWGHLENVFLQNRGSTPALPESKLEDKKAEDAKNSVSLPSDSPVANSLEFGQNKTIEVQRKALELTVVDKTEAVSKSSIAVLEVCIEGST